MRLYLERYNPITHEPFQDKIDLGEVVMVITPKVNPNNLSFQIEAENGYMIARPSPQAPNKLLSVDIKLEVEIINVEKFLES